MLDLLALDVACAHPFLTVSISGDGVRHWSAPPLANGTGLHLDMDANPHRGLWALQLDNAVRAAREPTILLAEGLACLAIARWAQLSPPSYVANIAGAYLFAPLSFSPAQAPLLRNLHPGPEVRLPFPSLVIDSRASLSIARVALIASSSRRRSRITSCAALGSFQSVGSSTLLFSSSSRRSNRERTMTLSRSTGGARQIEVMAISMRATL